MEIWINKKCQSWRIEGNIHKVSYFDIRFHGDKIKISVFKNSNK